MIHTFDLTGKIVLVTGGYGYLGKGIVESLGHHGATVYVLGRSENKFKKAFQKNSDAPGKQPRFQVCDISDSTSIASAFKAIESREKGMDVLINNAFYLDGQDPLAMTDAQWNSGIEGTLSSVFRCIREAVPYLKKSSAPRIINVSSMYGMVAPDFGVYENFPESLNPPHYGAAKAGVIQISKYYASYLGKSGITVNTVSPGPFPSKEVQKKDAFIKLLKEKTSLKRIGTPEDLGGIFVYLASDASGYMTGQNLVVDGGWTIT